MARCGLVNGVRSQNSRHLAVQGAELCFKQLPSGHSDDAGLQGEPVRLLWRLAMAVRLLVAHSVHPY